MLIDLKIEENILKVQNEAKTENIKCLYIWDEFLKLKFYWLLSNDNVAR